MPDNSTSKPTGAAGDSDARSVPGGDAVVPEDLKVKLAEQKLEVLWKDGRRSEFSSAMLRRCCPCATCQAKAGETKSASETDQDRADILSAQLVGAYAIQFDFSDGHNTGIYDFRYLRSLDEERND